MPLSVSPDQASLRLNCLGIVILSKVLCEGSYTYWGIGVGPLAGLGEHRLGKIWMEILTEVCLE